ncbi:hypothetical protein F2Q70_00037553 [Brassica cretica]|uniref:Uncharacterized protein n=1 Tax=Brassica cretica TaxID=69181 RepID=A0A8S9JU25_BRACR|nr:hypothetical protein F2Q70_00037553 [Brassica cretica]
MDQPRKTRAVGEASKPENLSQIQQPPSTNPSSSIPSSPTPPAPSLSPNPSQKLHPIQNLQGNSLMRPSSIGSPGVQSTGAAQ